MYVCTACMYVCMYMYVHVCTVCMDVIRVYVILCMYVCMYGCNTCVCMSMHMYVCMFVCMYVTMYMYISMYMYDIYNMCSTCMFVWCVMVTCLIIIRSSGIKEQSLPVVVSGVPTPDFTTEPIDPDEPTYCLCNQVSFGEMIGCDNDEVSEWGN